MAGGYAFSATAITASDRRVLGSDYARRITVDDRVCWKTAQNHSTRHYPAIPAERQFAFVTKNSSALSNTTALLEPNRTACGRTLGPDGLTDVLISVGVVHHQYARFKCNIGPQRNGIAGSDRTPLGNATIVSDRNPRLAATSRVGRKPGMKPGVLSDPNAIAKSNAWREAS